MTDWSVIEAENHRKAAIVSALARHGYAVRDEQYTIVTHPVHGPRFLWRPDVTVAYSQAPTGRRLANCRVKLTLANALEGIERGVLTNDLVDPVRVQTINASQPVGVTEDILEEVVLTLASGS